MEINWQQFGLRSNPYATHPLIEGGELSLQNAFIGREEERGRLNALFDSSESLCMTLCGETGVGKTSLANIHKFEWKYQRPKLLFSCRREIEASDTLLNKQSFLLEIIGSVLREIELLDSKLLKDPLLSRLLSLVDVTQMIAISGGISADIGGYGGGLNFSRDKSGSLPPNLTTSAVEKHFGDLLNFITTHTIGGLTYSGLIIHVNNFDVLLREKEMRKKVIAFFDAIRDILQTPKLYSLFLGPTDFYSEIIGSQQRVKSIFVRTPLILKPLSKTQVVSALEKRMEILKSEGVERYIAPIENDVVYRLHDLYDGDIRSVMTGIKDILSQCEDRLLQPLSANEALYLLGQERWERIKNHLTKEQQKIVEFLVKEDKEISIKEVANVLGKQASNVSGYYFKPLKELGIIEEKRRQGKRIYLGLTVEYQPLKWWFISQKEIRKELTKVMSEQNRLF